LRTVLRSDSGLTELVMELMVEPMDRGFRNTLIRGWKYDWNCAVDLDCVNYSCRAGWSGDTHGGAML